MRGLIISSKNPEHSADLGKDLIRLLKSVGCEIDYLTMYGRKNDNPNIITIFEETLSFKERTKQWVRSLYKYTFIRNVKNIIKKIQGKSFIHNEEKIQIRYPDEKLPGINPALITKKINKVYDFVITLFWEPMINTTSLKAIYDKLRCPILLYALDMAPMTGGCYYFSNCEGYRNKCLNCLIYNKDNYQSHNNFMIKKDNYDGMNIWWLGNTYMNKYVKETGLFTPEKILNVSLYLNENEFIPGDREKIRRKLRIKKDQFIILVASSNAVRKGVEDACKVILELRRKIWEEKNKDLLIVTIGDDYVEKTLRFERVKVKNFGIVNKTQLIKLYNIADVFLCCSKDDAGPSMVNQSILCGTPVVTYDSGTAIDVVENGKSGYKSPKGDLPQLVQNLKKIYDLSAADYQKLRNETRSIALQMNSLEAGRQRFQNILDRLK